MLMKQQRRLLLADYLLSVLIAALFFLRPLKWLLWALLSLGMAIVATSCLPDIKATFLSQVVNDLLFCFAYQVVPLFLAPHPSGKL